MSNSIKIWKGYLAMGLLQAVFVGLKLVGVVGWPWLWVLIPLLSIGVVVAFVAFVLAVTELFVSPVILVIMDRLFPDVKG